MYIIPLLCCQVFRNLGIIQKYDTDSEPSDGITYIPICLENDEI